MKAEHNNGVAVLCDAAGMVEVVVREEPSLLPLPIATGRNVLSLIDPVDEKKGFQFLCEITSGGLALDWEMTVSRQGSVRRLYFAGTRIGNEMLVVAAPSIPKLEEATQELAADPCQPQGLRAMARQLSEPIHQRIDSVEASASPCDEDLLEEITRMNNELANFQRELFSKNAQLETLNALRTEFLGVAAHEMRHPVGVILAYCEFLRDELALNLEPEQRQLMAVINDTSRSLLRLSNQLLDLTRMESGILDLEIRETDLAALANYCVQVNLLLAKNKQIALSLVSDPMLPPSIPLDRSKMEEVFSNLIGNAVKFSPEHSQVVVRLKREGDAAVVTVADNGPGIPQQQIKELFKPFGARIGQPAAKRGSGLGLYIVSRIIESHQGTITVESGEGKGTLVRLCLPLERTTGGLKALTSAYEGGCC